MIFFLRFTLLICLTYAIQAGIINHIYYESRQLALFGNLPHRYLGGLFWCQQMQPQREDYEYTYLVEWMLADKEERLLEGQTRPVVPMLAVRKATIEFPFDPDLEKLKDFVMKNHFAEMKKKEK